MTEQSRHTIDGLRARLFAVLDRLQDETKPLDVERANATVEVARTLIASAKVQVDYLRATGQTDSQDAFLQPAPAETAPALPPAARANPAEPGNGIVSITRHALKG
jgi:hypothetical protein